MTSSVGRKTSRTCISTCAGLGTTLVALCEASWAVYKRRPGFASCRVHHAQQKSSPNDDVVSRCLHARVLTLVRACVLRRARAFVSRSVCACVCVADQVCGTTRVFACACACVCVFACARACAAMCSWTGRAFVFGIGQRQFECLLSQSSCAPQSAITSILTCSDWFREREGRGLRNRSTDICQVFGATHKRVLQISVRSVRRVAASLCRALGFGALAVSLLRSQSCAKQLALICTAGRLDHRAGSEDGAWRPCVPAVQPFSISGNEAVAR